MLDRRLVVSERLIPFVVWALGKKPPAVLRYALHSFFDRTAGKRKIDAPIRGEHEVINRVRDSELVYMTEHEPERIRDAPDEGRVVSCRGNVHGENSIVRESPFHLAEELFRRKVKRDIDLLRVGIDNDDVVFSFSQVYKDTSVLIEHPHRVDKGEVGPGNLYYLWVYFHAVNANLRIKIVEFDSR